jgi:CarD family transcriptional regulator
LAPDGANPFLFACWCKICYENANKWRCVPDARNLNPNTGGKMTEKKAKIETKSDDFKMREFHVGDLAVYPAHGVGEIQAIESRVVNGEKHNFYIMKVIENGMVIMIPIANVESVGLRAVIDEKDVPKVYKVMKFRNESMPDNQTWNRRYREYMDKIKTGSLYDVAEVFRDLFLLKLNKDLSFGERKLYDTAQVLLVRELSTAKDSDEKTILSEIESLFVSDSTEN